jgi:peptidoglycan/LPS O-acetylase OafA/YrhL
VAQQHRYIPTLDGWRGFAVIGVILYHGRFGFFKADSELIKLSAHGFIGVDLFFALSGFLICGLLLEEHRHHGGISLRRFYIRRCFRILPPYYAALAGLCILSVFGAIHVNLSYMPSCLLFYRNYKPLGMDAQSGFYTAHFWTLAVEEHFYLIWPMLLVMLARTDARMDALLWGCLAAIYFPVIKRHAERIRFSQLWLPILTILLVAEAFHAPGLIFLRVVLLPALVLSTVLQPRSVLGRILEWRALRWIGTISYSLYLWQELFLPELAAEKAAGFFHYLQQPPWSVLAIVLCACLSRYLLELPMIRLGHRLSATVPGPGSSPRSTLSPNLSLGGV